MLHTQALVTTDRPSQIAAAAAAELGMEFSTEWSAEAGWIALPDGICDMHSWPEGLRLDAFAETADGLGRIEDLMKRHLERATPDGRRIEVAWHRRPAAA
jgi:hypothetical protein